MAMREYRKGNWTVEETMILIEAKKKDDERRKFDRSKQAVQSITSSGSGSTSKPATELRWKWVEEYCWGKGCLRSQNQCNDKWDNLMRDYKKVREYQKNLGDLLDTAAAAGAAEADREGGSSRRSSKDKSYWSMDKVERKEKGLPTNMLPQIYQSLFDVVEGSSSITTIPTPTPTPTSTLTPTPTPSTTSAATTVAQFLLPPPVLLEMQQSVPAMQLSPPPSLLPPPLQPPPPPASAFLSPQQLSPHPSPTLELSPAKRRRKEEGVGGSGIAVTHTATTATATAAAAPSTTTSLEEVSSAISRSATMISEAIQASQEREEWRHREIMNIHESRLRIEESKLEINRQGLNGLADAINRLATSIFTWANSHKNQQGPS